MIVTVLATSSVNAEAPASQKAETENSFEEALQKEQQQAARLSPAMKQLSPGSSGAVVPQENLNIKKAEGADSYTVGECFEKARELDNTKVIVRGKVMKVSTMIMGKNWVHIQDGTGYSMNSTHDLVVTTQAMPEKGSVVTFSGTLRANRDFGFGYKYATILEEAELL